jgi:hypothetical protein
MKDLSITQTADDTQSKSSAKEKLTLLGHVEKIEALFEKHGLTNELLAKGKKHLEVVAKTLQLTDIQAALFVQFISMSDDQEILIQDISKKSKCSTVRIIQLMDDIDVLEKRKFICGCRSRKNISYRVPMAVINALRKGEVYTPVSHKNISIDKFFAVLEEFFEKLGEEELTTSALQSELGTLMEDNMQLEFVQKIKNFALDDDDSLLLIMFCHLFVNNHDDNIGFHDLESLYSRNNKRSFRRVQRLLRDGDHVLMAQKILENTSNDGFGDRESFKLTDKTKKDLLAELDINVKSKKNYKKGLILHDAIAEKKLFYNEKEEKLVAQLSSLLQIENFKTVQKRLTDSGMRTGFACIFYGAPGTGKTETAYQLAHATGRDIMQVNIAETKSMWFGGSEKKIKEVFDDYRKLVKNNEVAPILLFNEADAVIGKRKDVGSGNVAQTENAIQNIILQEMENLEGIMVATTNLTQNLDKAFERRFLYKIEFEKPSMDAKHSIWKTMIPELADSEAKTLAQTYDFSGGQIENISRKRTVDSIISGAAPSLEAMHDYCRSEQLNKTGQRGKIGF